MPESAVNALFSAMNAVAKELPALSPRDRSLLLRDFVCATVDELRENGRSSARIVTVLRDLAQEAGIEPEDEAVMSDLAAWCVQRYYAPASRTRAS